MDEMTHVSEITSFFKRSLFKIAFSMLKKSGKRLEKGKIEQTIDSRNTEERDQGRLKNSQNLVSSDRMASSL